MGHPGGVPTPLTCPVCGFQPLATRPYADYTGQVPPEACPPYEEFLGQPSYDVCSACGFEFGNDDNPGTAEALTFAQYRDDWLARGGAPFQSRLAREGWSFEVDETSPGAYLVTGTDARGRSVRLRGTDPGPLLAEARRWLRSVQDQPEE